MDMSSGYNTGRLGTNSHNHFKYVRSYLDLKKEAKRSRSNQNVSLAMPGTLAH